VSDLASVAAVPEDEELQSETMKLWESWKNLVNSADTLCWSSDKEELRPAAEIYTDSVAGISSQFLRFTAAWIFPDGWQAMDEIPPDWTPVDPSRPPQDES
jgi:hypothetical protein